MPRMRLLLLFLSVISYVGYFWQRLNEIFVFFREFLLENVIIWKIGAVGAKNFEFWSDRSQKTHRSSFKAKKPNLPLTGEGVM